ncbi:AraC family transcriptional regulator [Desulfosporosinus meridiei]|uniref:DNA-binding domain-containing protein, AraC-type n=1 Tax=Desulfosporosinus meridiei (strain ATCC BAA-275 / DSM 13257 / KCTC 12902 / NCIMB 13706 / S10) TaxID=768704 RepID=J7IV86_DESMD|nr:AraC family transcriptional regulator [Desulfosporosinus meridiei]AFQ42621.1 DNA-binding domain-containing protein, AraC-type [Desulfosporosinus meridiei DSM 13257]
MNYKTDMERCLNYIEAHICEDISPRRLAELLGYSFYHFCHVFRVCNDMPVGEYLRKRRLQKALEALDNGEQITNIALALGFETPSGFSKAFRREFGMSASTYRRSKGQRIKGNKKGEKDMQVTIAQKDGFKAVGYSIAPREGNKAELIKLGAYWLGSDFSSVSYEDYDKLAGGGADQIGMWFHPEEKDGDLSYFFGPVVDNFDFVPQGMVTVEVPSAEYAVFTTDPADLANDKQAFAEVIQRTLRYVFEEWFEKSDYSFDQTKYAFEFYTNRNGGMDSNQAVADIYIPIKKK